MICATCGLDRPQRTFLVTTKGRHRRVKWCDLCRAAHAARVAQGPRAQGTNPRALGTNPRARRTDPRTEVGGYRERNEAATVTRSAACAAWHRLIDLPPDQRRRLRRELADLERLVRNRFGIDPRTAWGHPE